MLFTFVDPFRADFGVEQRIGSHRRAETKGEAVGDGLVGTVFVGVGIGAGVGAAATLKRTGIWAAASVPVGSVKLMVPT